MNLINKLNKIKSYIFFNLIILFIITNYNNAISLENKIEFKINNEIISTIDINNEIKYLTSLNPRLLELNKQKIKEISINSAIKEKIKKIEINKFKKNIIIDEEYLSKLVETNYKKININSEKEFINFLEKKGLNYEEFKIKITIEHLWNEIIYLKFRSKIIIDKEKLKKEIIKISNKQYKYSYNLSEIVFSINNQDELSKITKLIKKDINEKGFENAASIHSISSSSSLGGKLGWIESNQLNEKIRTQIEKLNIGENTQPYTIPGGLLILKLNDIKKEKKKININKELEKIIRSKTNEQLNQFSNIYFNKIKKDIKIEKI